MTCADARDVVLAHARGALPPGDDAAVREHLASCAACARVDHVDRMLSEVLEQRLPKHPASLALKRRLAAEWPAPPRARTSFKRFVMPALAAAAVVLALTPQLYHRLVVVPGDRNALVTEAVNDHVRLLLSQRPMDVESSDVHQVKPWFAGRLDFAPAVAFDGDAEFPLRAAPSAISSTGGPRCSSTVAACTPSRSSSFGPTDSTGRSAAWRCRRAAFG